MDKGAIAEILEEIGELLELKGENVFKTRAYANAARALDTLDRDLGEVIAAGELGKIKGIGKALCEKITTLHETGQLPYYEELRASFPEGLLELKEIPGLGPKKIVAVNKELGVESVDALEQACRDGKVAGLDGFGKKSQESILEGIAQHRQYSQLHRRSDILPVAEELRELLRSHPDVSRCEVGGSLRRGKEISKDIDLLVSSKRPRDVMDAFCGAPGVERVVGQGETKSSVVLEGGLACDLRVVDDKQFASALHHFTGSKEHNVAMRQRAIAQGKKLSEWGLFAVTKSKKGEEEETLIPVRTEAELFHELGLAYIPPELRENLGEIEAAEDGKLPKLVDWTNLRGCFHFHTTASDGKNTLEEMCEAAADLGLEYIGVADHSKASFQANGLDEERLQKQINDVQALNKKLKGFTLFSGSEVDILPDGKLDFADETLARLDFAVASVHSVLNQPETEATKRVIRALENPYVTMLGHATGRLLLAREPTKLNLDKVIDAAAETGTWIELNANGYRLDMDWRWWHQARDKGVKCVINPDAHRTDGFGCLPLGVTIARKGWLRKEDVVNTQPAAKMKKLLAAKREMMGAA
ncbi:MAG: DNA polymerase/3'-5' exonuclease PolX [Verrucomicrobiota bacterium]